MPPKPLPLVLAGRRSFICKSCLLQLWRSPQIIWPARYSSVPRHSLPPQREQRLPQSPLSAGERGEEKPVVRYFQEEQPGRYRRLRDAEEFSDSMNNLDEQVEARLKELEAKLQDPIELARLMDKYGLQNYAGKLKARYNGIGEEEEDESPLSRLPKIPEDVFPSRQRRGIAVLNSYLKAVRRKRVDAEIVLKTWKYYSTVRKMLSSNRQSVPAQVWELLWRILSSDVKGVANRMDHVFAISQDIQAAGVVLTDEQKLLAVESMFITGWEKEAIDNWKKLIASLGSQQEVVKDYWALGVRMYCLFGDLERAERAANMLFEASPDADARILVPLIRACAKNEATQDRAWKAYRRLRGMLGSSMTIEDYDEVISCFLASNGTEYGLHVFVDMMFSGAVDLENKTRLPSQVANLFFLGKWLKRLIGAGDLDGAFGVLKFMQGRGIMAAPIQVNGLIGAWMRSGTAENQQRAEDLAWAMIYSRQVYVDLRRRQRLMEWPLVLTASTAPLHPRRSSEATSSKASASELRFVPRATLETFSLLAENYRTRGLHQRLEDLWLAFTDSEISTGAFLANQLLESYIQQGQAHKAREFYDTLTKEHNLSPDAHTFLALFRSLPVNHLYAAPERDGEEGVRLCRQIFRSMVLSHWTFDSEWIFGQLPRMVLHSFRKLKDYVGFLVALRAMRKLFDLAPSETLLMEMAATLAPKTHTRQRQLLYASSRVEELLRQRMKQLEAEGQALTNPTPEQRTDELSLILEQLFWPLAKIPDGEFQHAFRTTAEEMGVYDIVVAEDAQAVSKNRKLSAAAS